MIPNIICSCFIEKQWFCPTLTRIRRIGFDHAKRHGGRSSRWPKMANHHDRRAGAYGPSLPMAQPYTHRHACKHTYTRTFLISNCPLGFGAHGKAVMLGHSHEPVEVGEGEGGAQGINTTEFFGSRFSNLSFLFPWILGYFLLSLWFREKWGRGCGTTRASTSTYAFL